MTTRPEANLARLADIVDGHAERFVPGLMEGRLIDAEHRGRYWWAAALVPNKRVLDAACGTGYGTKILLNAGAREVVGVDRAMHVIEAARQEALRGAVFEVADLLQLPFPEQAFDVAVCFEAIEHVNATDVAIDELARVLSRDGVLAISSPNRSVYIEGNPHHRHEYVPRELETALRTRFDNVRLVRQHDWLAAAIFEDACFEAGDGAAVERAEARKIMPAKVGVETYTLALASNGPLPMPPPVVVLTQDVEIRHLLEQSTAAEQAQQQVTELLREGEERHRLIANLESEARRAQALTNDAHERMRQLEMVVVAEQEARARVEATAHERIQQLDIGIAAEQAARVRAEAALQAIMRTKTFRYTRGLRAVYGRLLRLPRLDG